MTAPATRPTALPSPVVPKTPGPNSGKPADATPADAPKVVAKPAVKVDGSTGPYNPDKPGGFGANASENFKTLAGKEPDKAATATIRYMPEGKLNFNDAFGYAQRDLALIDKDKKGYVEPAQLTQFFAGGSKDEKVVKTATEMSDAYFKAIDTDGNKKITGDEMAAYIMFQDNPKDPLLQTLAAMGEDPKLKPTVEKYQKELEPLVAKVDSTLDGQITPQERALAEGAVFAMPALTGRYLKEFSQVKFENKGNKTLQELYTDFSKTPLTPVTKPADK